jgi:excisionase family DNA binding protein
MTGSSVHTGPIAVIDGYSCHLLNQYLGKLRSQVRGRDPQFDAALLMIHRAGLEYVESSCRGTSIAPRREPKPDLGQQETVGTTTAATILGITDRAVRKAITEKRLPATQLDGRWRITVADLALYKAQR